jgi:hypothetical protein
MSDRYVRLSDSHGRPYGVRRPQAEPYREPFPWQLVRDFILGAAFFVGLLFFLVLLWTGAR